ncbi:hypothetical protein BH23CHL5_BH23CHL5_15890 [soil metagenome]
MKLPKNVWPGLRSAQLPATLARMKLSRLPRTARETSFSGFDICGPACFGGLFSIQIPASPWDDDRPGQNLEVLAAVFSFAHEVLPFDNATNGAV